MKKILFLLPFILTLSSCILSKQNTETVYLDEVTASADDSELSFQGSRTMLCDLVHTELDLKFNFLEKTATGKALLSLKPHFYPQDSVQIDARGFEIRKIALVSNNSEIPLKYSYNNLIISVKLDKFYSRKDTFKLAIDYTAFPDRLPEGGSWAIKSDKGLYFIDNESNNPQFWTQGETQSNSAWFPTIDAPNQKTTQDISLTVPKDFKTLSNGLLIKSIENENDTRTDRWIQSKPHAPYLVMIAAGRYEILENSWNDLAVNVYAEPSQTKKAKLLFEKTDQMLSFYSEKLNYEFAWDKYSQIVVRQFVSGAMENTSATVFGNYVLNYDNETERREYETVVAHELSHHWFGDLVTCESWANLPLNESFATYFEYLWIEHEYGRAEADAHLKSDYNSYMFEYIFKNEDLIRFYHKHRDDMFDGHSYQKGSLILHYLRKIVGDEAFWKSLELYLKRNEFKSVEIHDLRLAFEEVTGQDLNWFFNEFFLNKGFPELTVTTEQITENKVFRVSISQTQEIKKAPLYRLPLYVDFYFEDTVLRREIVVNQREQHLYFKFDKQPLLTIVDAENALPGKIRHSKTLEQYLIQGQRSTLYRDVAEVLDVLKSQAPSDEINTVYIKILEHPYAPLRKRALAQLKVKPTDKIYAQYKSKLESIIETDQDSEIRALAKSKLMK